MKDLTLKFPGNREFKSFLSSLDWEEDEDLQNKLLVDEIGFTYTETGVTEEGEPGFAPIFPDICYHLTHYKPAAADIPVASDNPAHYADAIRYNARTPLQGSLLPLTRLVWA